MIAILDYGLGNVRSIANMLAKTGVRTIITPDPHEVERADKVILPGVGAFDSGIQALERSGLRAVLEDVVGRGVPLLGICLGMQLLALSSEEGKLPGLGMIPGRVMRLLATPEVRIPHMGWAHVEPRGASILFPQGVPRPRFYFLHSYVFEATEDDTVLATVTYGTTFACAVQRANIFGVQFHPEKSHRFGLELLRRWASAP